MPRFNTLVTLDYETFYSQSYTLKKLTTENYIRHPDFKAHMVGLKINSEPAFVVPSGDIQHALNQFDWKKTAVLMHHAHFDGLIMSHHHRTKPCMFFDTLSMARGLHGTQVGGSLAKLATHYGVGEKGRELADSLGIRDLPPGLYQRIAGYCANDVELTYALFMAMRKNFPAKEYDVIDAVVKMFTRPALELDGDELATYITEEQQRKENLLALVASRLGYADQPDGPTAEDQVRSAVMSNRQFADLLELCGVEPPMKISPATGKPTLALAKSDRGMTDLLEHDDELVRDLVSVRLGVKSSINETRAIRMLEMGERGKACVYLNYSGAFQTHRLSGGDKMNWQNFPARDGKARLRHAIRAPRGTSVVACDSSNIELRVNMAAAGQRDVVESLRRGEDLYCGFASTYYRREITKADKPQRDFGKCAILGLGFGMGDEKFRTTARVRTKQIVSPEDSARTVKLYRSSYSAVPRWWYFWDDILPTLAAGRTAAMHEIGIKVQGGCIHLPTGLPLQYPELRQDSNGDWVMRTRSGWTKTYGAKLVENITQAMARNIVMEQTVTISRRYPVVMSVHDEVVFLCREGEEDEASAFAVEVMSTTPSWFPDLPLAAEAEHGKTYGECK